MRGTLSLPSTSPKNSPPSSPISVVRGSGGPRSVSWSIPDPDPDQSISNYRGSSIQLPSIRVETVSHKLHISYFIPSILIFSKIIQNYETIRHHMYLQAGMRHDISDSSALGYIFSCAYIYLCESYI